MIPIDNPAFDYDSFGQTYGKIRQTDPRIAKFVYEALADANTIINVGSDLNVDPKKLVSLIKEAKQ